MKTIILKTILSLNADSRNQKGHSCAQRGFLLIPLILVCFAVCQQVQSAPVQEFTDGPEQVQTAAPDTPDPGPLPVSNTADGQLALASIATGIYNSAFGFYSLLSLTEGSFNTGVGAGTLMLNTSSNNTAVGTGALFSNTTGSNNTAHGTFALFNNIDGVEHTAVGFEALLNTTTGNDNTAVGLFALLNNVDGTSNTAVGAAALRDNVSGDDNQALGRGALRFSTGSNNIGIGREAGTSIVSASNMVAIGVPGAGPYADISNTCFIGSIFDQPVSDSGTAQDVYVDQFNVLGFLPSSQRFKHDIQPMDKASEQLYGLKPVTFKYNSDKTGRTQYGVIAEEVAKVAPDLVFRDMNGDVQTVRFEQINAMLLNEFLKEHKKVEEQQASITRLNSEMATQAAIIARQQKGMEALTAQLNEQAAQLQKVSAKLEVSKPTERVVSSKQ
jgi:hypothetical protein